MGRALGGAAADDFAAETGRYVGTLFDDHGPRVYGLCRLLLRDPVEAEDAAQQTFLSAYRSLLSGHAPRDPPVWLSTIARNECRARIRARAAERLSPIADAEAARDDVEQIASRQEEIDVLRDALTELPEPQREAIVLREFYGLSYEEVGAASGLSISAVKSVLFRARTRLKTRLRAPRGISGVALLPLALRDALAQAVPGFASAEAGGGALAKVATIPLAAKLAGATMSVAVVGVLGGAGADTDALGLHGLSATSKSAAAPAPTAAHLAAVPPDPTRPASAPPARKVAAVPAKVENSKKSRDAGEAEEAEEQEMEMEVEVEAAEAEREDADENARAERREHEEPSENE